MQTASSPLGHNLPPSDVDILQERLRGAHADLLNHANELCDEALVAKNVEINDDAGAGPISDLIKLITGTRKNLESARVSEKEPFLAHGRAVDGFFKLTIDKLDNAMRTAKAPLDEWLRKKAAAERRARDEEARRLREQQETERKAALLLQQTNQKEAAATLVDQSAITGQQAAKAEVLAEARPAHLSQTRSAGGAMAQLRTRWVGELLDQKTIDLEKLRHHINPDHLQAALNSYVRAGGRELMGAKIHEVSEAVVR